MSRPRAISPALLNPGDTVQIKDETGNLTRGVVAWREFDQTLVIDAFGVRIPFARRREGGAWHRVSGLVVTEHQPQLVEAVSRSWK
jgi:hypothetical protein